MGLKGSPGDKWQQRQVWELKGPLQEGPDPQGRVLPGPRSQRGTGADPHCAQAVLEQKQTWPGRLGGRQACGEESERQQAACGLLATEVGRAGARVAALPPGSDSEGLGRPGSGASRSWRCCLGAGAYPSKSLAGAEQEVCVCGGVLLAGTGSCIRCGEGRSWEATTCVTWALTWLSDLRKFS